MSEETNTIALPQTVLLDLTTQVVAAYVGRNDVPPSQITDLIHTVFATLKDISIDKPVEVVEPQKPAVPIKRSVFPDYIICLEDGKKLKMLKRHLRTAYNLTPDDYRAKWGLPADYPMVAPNYAEQRSQFAKQIGLGRTGLADVTRGRRKKISA